MPDARARLRRLMRMLGVGAAGLLLISGCAGVSEPRWSSASATGDTPASAASPRVTIAVEAAPDVGVIVLSAIVHSDDAVSFVAPSGGVVSDVRLEVPGDVALGQDVLTFLPDPTSAGQLELDIAELERALAEEQEDAAGVAAALESIAALEDEQRQRAEVIVSPSSGWISGARNDLEYRVDEGAALFTVSDPESVVARIILPGDVVPLAIEDTVAVLASDGSRSSGVVRTIAFDADSDRSTIDVSFEAGVALGDQVDVEIPVAPDGARTWLPSNAVHRFDGASFVLIQNDDGSLTRSDVRIGRRTASHVEVVEQTSGAPFVAGMVLVLP